MATASGSDIEMEPVDSDVPQVPETHGSHALIEDEINDLQAGDDIIDQFDKWQIALDNAEDIPI
ncbi:hypothetical protein FRC11_008487 [Ceratobasidium sp. 423]|nr:hypothetical protein FRC11_008487 [Ceratobasidium sp. 423]